MPRKPSPVPIYRLHRASGQAVCTINRKVEYLGKWDSPESHSNYARLIAEKAASPSQAIVSSAGPAPADFTVNELVDAYLLHAQVYYTRHGKPSHWLRHIKLILTRLCHLYGDEPCVAFGPLRFKAVRQSLIAEGHSRKYINKLMAIIPRAFKWGAAEELFGAEVYANLKTVETLHKGRSKARETPPVRPVDDATVDATLPFMPRVVTDMVRFAQATGARPSEVCLVRPCDIDRSGPVWQYRPQFHKTDIYDKPRVIYIGPRGQAVLLPYLSRDTNRFCFSPREAEEARHAEQRRQRKTRVQPSQRNRRKPRPQRAPAEQYTKDSFGRAVRRAVEKANRARETEAKERGIDPEKVERIELWSPNRLRHSAATRIRKSHGLQAAQTILGHANMRTSEIYAEQDAALAVSVAAAIG